MALGLTIAEIERLADDVGEDITYVDSEMRTLSEEIRHIRQLLVKAESEMDKANGKYGKYDKLCIFCAANKHDGHGIIHDDECIIKKLREVTEYDI